MSWPEIHKKTYVLKLIFIKWSVLSTKSKNCYVMGYNRHIYKICELPCRSNKNKLKVRQFLDKSFAFDYPLSSSFFDIYKISKLCKIEHNLSPSFILCKTFIFQVDKDLYSFPILHAHV